jgi:hypothetical protein
MLRALADAHRAQGDDAQAHEVLRAAEVLADHTGDDLPDDLRAWLALGEAVSGSPVAASGHLGRLPAADRTDAVSLLATLAGAVLAVESASDKRAAFAEAKEDIKAAAGACPPAELPVGIGRVYRRVVGKLAAVGGVRGKLWAWWQTLRPLVREG